MSGRRVTLDGHAGAYVRMMAGLGSTETQLRMRSRLSCRETSDAEVSDVVRRLTGEAPIGSRDFVGAAAADGGLGLSHRAAQEGWPSPGHRVTLEPSVPVECDE